MKEQNTQLLEVELVVRKVVHDISNGLIHPTVGIDEILKLVKDGFATGFSSHDMCDAAAKSFREWKYTAGQEADWKEKFEQWVANNWTYQNPESAACRGSARMAMEWICENVSLTSPATIASPVIGKEVDEESNELIDIIHKGIEFSKKVKSDSEPYRVGVGYGYSCGFEAGLQHKSRFIKETVTDGVEFHDWVTKSGYKFSHYNNENKCVYYHESEKMLRFDQTKHYYSSELYTLFQQSKTL